MVNATIVLHNFGLDHVT